MSKTATAVAKKFRGKFVVFDGPDGAGKSTQHERFGRSLALAGVEVLFCRDPGGTVIGDRIREVLLNYDLSGMNVDCETMLFMASRAQLVAEVVKPALEREKTVVCDRFVTSTCAYQGAAGFDPERVIQLARFALHDFWPDITVILDVDADEGMKRIGRKPKHAGKNRGKFTYEPTLFHGTGSSVDAKVDSTPDAMEARPIAYHRRVQRLFLETPRIYPAPVITIDGRGDVETVHERVMECLYHVAL